MARSISTLRFALLTLCAVVALAFAVRPAKATVQFYNNEAAFRAAASGINTVNFNGIAPTGTYIYYGKTATFVGINFNSYFGLYVVDPANSPLLFDYGTGGVLTASHDIWANLPAGVTAVGMYVNTRLYKQDNLYVNLSTGESYTLITNGGAKNGFQFIGFVSDSAPISAIYLSTGLKNALVVDNFLFGTAAQ